MMATSVIGYLPEFNPEDDNTASYLEQVELFFEANNIAEEKKVAVFLFAVGQKTYEILRHHSAPKLPREKSFDEIVTLFKQQFQHSPVDAGKSTDSAQSQPSVSALATSVIGFLPEFNPENDNTASYLEKVELFFEANNIAEEKKVAVFLFAVGQKTYEILRHHSAPKLPREKSFDEIVTLFKQQFQRSPVDAGKSTDSAQSQPSGKKVNYS